MTPDEARKIIGGYATGNLTGEERQALFETALNDQDLFDSLVKEEGLKDALADPEIRKRLLGQLQPPRRGFFGNLTAWRWAAAAGVALATIAIAVVVIRGPGSPEQAPVLTAMKSRAPFPAEPSNASPLQDKAPPSAPRKIRPAAPPETRPALRQLGRLADQRSNVQLQNEVNETSRAKVLKEVPADAVSERKDAAQAGAATAASAPAVPSPAPAPPAPAPMASTLEVQKRGQAEELSKGTLSKDADEPLRYQVLRRGADGNFTEVPRETLFETGDAVRLRVFSPPEAGTLALTKGGTLVGSTAAEPGRAYVLPLEDTITISGAPAETHLVLRFVPSQGPQSIMAFRREQAPKRQEKSKLSAGSGVFKIPSIGPIEIVLRHR